MNVQCCGTTKNGQRCKLTGPFENGYCHLHKIQAPPVSEKPQIAESEPQPLQDQIVQPESPAVQPEFKPSELKRQHNHSLLIFLVVFLLAGIGLFKIILFSKRLKAPLLIRV